MMNQKSKGKPIKKVFAMLMAFAMMITLILTGNVYLKKKGYVFVTEDEEA